MPPVKSPFWQFFRICEDDSKFVQCLLCHALLSRGGDGKKASTSPMKNHMERKHPDHLPKPNLSDSKPNLRDSHSSQVIPTEATATKVQPIARQLIEERPNSTPPHRKSPYWKFFQICEDARLAQCLLCGAKVSRGGDKKKASTTPLKSHLHRKHPDQLPNLNEEEASSPVQFVPSPSDTEDLPQKDPTQPNLLWDVDDPKSVKYHYLIGEMIAMDNEPISIVERIGFQRLMEEALPQYKIPVRSYLTEKIIPDIYKRIRSKIGDSISEATAVSLASDLWICQQSNQRFLKFAAHWVSPEFNPEHCILVMKPFYIDYTVDNIVSEISDIVDSWNINHDKIHLVVRDSAETSKFTKTKYDLTNCFIHSVQKTVEEALQSQDEVQKTIAEARQIVDYFQNSGLAPENLESIRTELNLPNQKLIQDVSTRWISTYYLMSRLLQQKEAVCVYTTRNEASLNNLTPSQWDILKQCTRLLQPFEEVIRITSSGVSCISEVIPHLNTLLKFLYKKETVEVTPNLYNVRSNLIDGLLESCYDYETSAKHLVATFLDPRFKSNFMTQALVEKAREKILLEALKLTSDSNDEDYFPVSKKRNVSSENYNGENTEIKKETETTEDGKDTKTENVTEKELDLYLESDTADQGANPFMWWSANSQQYPGLAALARIYLSAPGSSIYGEPLFSEAGSAYEEKRNRLLTENAGQLAFIHHNLPLVGYNY